MTAQDSRRFGMKCHLELERTAAANQQHEIAQCSGAKCSKVVHYATIGGKYGRLQKRLLFFFVTNAIRLSMFELRETGDWDPFLGPPERARARLVELTKGKSGGNSKGLSG